MFSEKELSVQITNLNVIIVSTKSFSFALGAYAH